MRLLYSLAWWLALPLVLLRLWWRGREQPGYRRHVVERLGFYPGMAFEQKKIFWVHAVSVGETRAAEPLIEGLLATYPECAILLTHMTPTGRATGRTLFSQHGKRLQQCYLPYDTGWMVARFLRRFAPQVCILMETEVWPNLIAQSAAHKVPVALVNARLSERSLARAHRLSALMAEAARGITCVAAQTEADAGRIRQLGVRRVHVTGSIKFDVTPPPKAQALGAALRRQLGSRAVLLCASTRDGEEALILDALRQAPLQDALAVIVPRHPQRFDRVAEEIAARGFAFQRRSLLRDGALASGVQVLLGDSMGEMFTYFAACDVAFIGGSLLPLGGQNLIEACALGKPVLAGPHTFNCASITEDAIAAGAALRVNDATAMLVEGQRLLQDEQVRAAMGAKAKTFARQHRGATERTLVMLQPLLR
jgi:3-deoxy-D-manno-octulosonic-acid transferase